MTKETAAGQGVSQRNDDFGFSPAKFEMMMESQVEKSKQTTENGQ